ncbi:MAG TPA: sigma-54 dependent transcriptional regulator [Bryobacteraceae bacterium]|nr:sigma-54 dependent transcriptional regulator [Bryobacteraceae bacterium]
MNARIFIFVSNTTRANGRRAKLIIVLPGKVKLAAIDDDPDLLALVASALDAEKDLELLTLTDPAEGLEVFRRQRPPIVLLDLMMPGISGMDVLDRIVAIDPATDVILMTAHYTTESVLEAIRKGACDYINKPFTREQLRERLAPVIAEARRRLQAQRIEEEMLEACRFQGVIGRSPLMREVFARARRVAPYFKTVLITGATGSGKEVLAQAIHRLSPMSAGPFIVCNCAAIPENLLESILFGHVRGAFTGAATDRAGMFEAAHGGTLFLDEIGEVPVSAQAKLLRALQTQEIQRVGSTASRRVDVRIVCATNRDLQQEMALKNFREDLFFRISMVTVKLPSLAERREDIPLLVRHFVDSFAAQYRKKIDGITRRGEIALLRHAWPGNVRELENVIGYACMMTQSNRVDACDLPAELAAASAPVSPAGMNLLSLEEVDRLHAHRVVEACGGDKIRACEILGVSRATLYRLLSLKANKAKA